MKNELEHRNATALIIGGGPALSLRLATRWLRSPWPVLHDPERSVYRAYGLEKALGLVQHSGTVVIDEEGTVRLCHSGLNPANAFPRAEVLTTLEATTSST